jgi:hypothetical protein
MGFSLSTRRLGSHVEPPTITLLCSAKSLIGHSGVSPTICCFADAEVFVPI